ncbi:penicillin acylase family protein, partial [Streptomyces sp. SID7499]|nr:penicillin acylase family protein [Streptomyces sp. SID7499]
ADYQDLYREQLRRTPDGGVEALGPDGWYRAHAHTETIEVAGADPETVEVIETDRGPVIIGGPDGDWGGAPGGGRGGVQGGDSGGDLGGGPGGVLGGGPGADASAEGPRAISLRHPPRVTGELGFDALPALLRARTVDDLDTALD